MVNEGFILMVSYGYYMVIIWLLYGYYMVDTWLIMGIFFGVSIAMGVSKMLGLFHGKSHLQMDDKYFVCGSLAARRFGLHLG